MKWLLLISVLVVGVISQVESNLETPHLYLMPIENYNLLPETLRPTIRFREDGYVVTEMSSEITSALSTRIHQKRSTCGGFIDLTPYLEKHQSIADAIEYLKPKNPTRIFDKLEVTYPNEVNKSLTFAKQDRFKDFLISLTEFPDRSALTDNGVKAAEYLKAEALKYAQDAGYTNITAESISTGYLYPQPSIIVKLPGSSQKPAIVIGGHMDTFGGGKPGADDDGTGSATVMEAFRAIIDSGMHFDRDVYFAFYAAEERGLVGSSYVVRYFQDNNINVRAVFHLDMTGYRPTQDKSDIYLTMDFVDANLTKFVRQLIVAYLGIPDSKIGTLTCGYACSDHASWFYKGVPAAYPFESSFDHYNPTIHTKDDTMALVNLEHAMKYVKLALAFIVETAEPIPNR